MVCLSAVNAFTACTTTGKAAVALGGVTVHSAFKMTMRHRDHDRGSSHSHRSTFRTLLRNIKGVIKDKFSMLSVDMVYVHQQEIRPDHRLEPFGGFDVLLCGDMRLLSPVRASKWSLSGQRPEGASMLRRLRRGTTYPSIALPNQVTSFVDLYISNKEGDKLFHHSAENKERVVADEFKLLEQQVVPTRFRSFEQLILDGETVLALVNVRSLATHVFDVGADPLLKHVHVLCLANTGMQPDEPF
ncbi:hypothetical protein HPB49_011714 [Dermacentor silvarum]|uniref:Uncharacterized protein n=1 Tax=Dermacentor silvarum TaxID=543639 RepID=A0ACB8C3D3_DERSI|nr:hypothetical protein HPB49_011714 [Dermacentor silvarum]